MLRPALRRVASARWPGARGGSGRTTIGVFTALQLLLLSVRPWAFLLPPPYHHHQQRRAASTTARPAFYTDDGLLPRMPARDWAVDFELTKGVAGSRKTQHAVDRAQAAGSSGEAANVLFLVKVGSNAQEIRSRMAGQHGLVFRRHGVTNHFVARSWDGGDEGSDGGGKPRRRGGRRKKGDEGAGAAAAGAAGVFLDGKGKGKGGGASYWVASFDAFVDCQLRVHEAMKEPLRTRGANFEWKRSELLRLVREGKHHGFRLKDGASADFVIVDESQDLRAEDVEILGRLVEAGQRNGGPLKRVLVVGDTEQTVFSDVISQGSEHPLDLLPSWMPSVDIRARRLDINYRCPHAHVHFNNLAMPRAPDALVRPSPEMPPRSNSNNATAITAAPTATRPKHQRNQTTAATATATAAQLEPEHKPYLFTYELSTSTTLNYDAYRTARRISEMVLALLRTMDGLRLKDIAITSRFVNANLVLMQLEDVLERALTEAGYAPEDGSGCVHLFRTKVTDRKSINFDEAGERLVMGSLAAFKGKDWRAVILLDCSEGVLPSKSSVHTTKELVDQSLFNVGTTRSREVLLIGFDAKQPSRYLANVKEKLPEQAQLEWAPETVEPSELYQRLLATRPPRQGAVEWNEGRNRTVNVPFKSYWSVTDTTDEIQTAEDILGQDPLKAYGFRSLDKFGSKLAPPKWFKDDEVGRLITGVMGEALLAREMHCRDMLARRADAALLWPVVEKLGRHVKGGKGGKKGRAEALFTEDAKLLNLCVDYELNELWAYEKHEEYRQRVQQLLEEHPGVDKEGLLRGLLDSTPKCLLHASHEAPLTTLGPLLDYGIPSAQLPPEAVWNCAVLYQDALAHGLRHPTLVRRLLRADDPRTPKGLGELLAGLADNAGAYLDFKAQRNSTAFSQGNAVGLTRTELWEGELERRGFCRERDRHHYENGWTFGVMGRIDFYDEFRKRVVEIKVSDYDALAPMHEVQTLLYALLFGRGWKPTRQFELVNLLKGVRYKRVLRREVQLWPCMQRAFKKLEFDDNMVEALGKDYGPQLWESEAARREAAAAADLEGEDDELEGEEDDGDESVADARLDAVIRQVMEQNPGLGRDGLLREVMRALADPASPVVLLGSAGAGEATGKTDDKKAGKGEEEEEEEEEEEDEGRAVVAPAAVRAAGAM